jgi:hypothetical protein
MKTSSLEINQFQAGENASEARQPICAYGLRTRSQSMRQEKSPDFSGLRSETTSNARGVTDKSAGPIRLASYQLGGTVSGCEESVNTAETALLGGNQGCTQCRSAVPGPTRLLPAEPSARQQEGCIFIELGFNVNELNR